MEDLGRGFMNLDAGRGRQCVLDLRIEDELTADEETGHGDPRSEAAPEADESDFSSQFSEFL